MSRRTILRQVISALLITTPMITATWPDFQPMNIQVAQGPSYTSYYEGAAVLVQGVVTMALKNGNFFISNPTKFWDSRPETSEGIFVYAPTVHINPTTNKPIRTNSESLPSVQVGTEVLVRGFVSEYVSQRNLDNLKLTNIRVNTKYQRVESTGRNISTDPSLEVLPVSYPQFFSLFFSS